MRQRRQRLAVDEQGTADRKRPGSLYGACQRRRAASRARSCAWRRLLPASIRQGSTGLQAFDLGEQPGPQHFLRCRIVLAYRIQGLLAQLCRTLGQLGAKVALHQQTMQRQGIATRIGQGFVGLRLQTTAHRLGVPPEVQGPQQRQAGRGPVVAPLQAVVTGQLRQLPGHPAQDRRELSQDAVQRMPGRIQIHIHVGFVTVSHARDGHRGASQSLHPFPTQARALHGLGTGGQSMGLRLQLLPGLGKTDGRGLHRTCLGQGSPGHQSAPDGTDHIAGQTAQIQQKLGSHTTQEKRRGQLAPGLCVDTRLGGCLGDTRWQYERLLPAKTVFDHTQPVLPRVPVAPPRSRSTAPRAAGRTSVSATAGRCRGSRAWTSKGMAKARGRSSRLGPGAGVGRPGG